MNAGIIIGFKWNEYLNIGILGHSRRTFDHPTLPSYFHYYSPIGFVGILSAIIISFFIIFIPAWLLLLELLEILHYLFIYMP